MTDLERLTPRQREIYNFVRDKICNRGFGPTVREIGEEFDIASPNGVMCHLRALEKKGLITREANKSRAIQLSDPWNEPSTGLPMVGRIAAGFLHEAIEQEERVDFSDWFSNSETVCFEVSGDSMIEDHIADGDLVVVRRQDQAKRGDIVIAQTDEGEATLKRWYPESNRIRLEPANSAMKPIYVRNAKVLGVVVGVVRRVG